MEHSSIVLSILICSLENRAIQLSLLLQKLIMQRGVYSNQLEILTEIDNGEMSVGEKRNLLLNRAGGEYICFIDDDDDVSDDYVSSIMESLKSKPDCVGIEGVLRVKGAGRDILFKHSSEFQGWYTGPDAFYRTPNHLNPVKRSIALSVGFPFMDNGEDHWYSNGIKTHIKSEIYINHPIYIYRKKIDSKKEGQK